MNKLLIGGGIFVAGAGVGLGTGYLVFKKKYQKLAEEEIESVREAYSKNSAPKPELEDIAAERRAENARRKALEADALADLMIENGYIPTTAQTDAEIFKETHNRIPSTYELIQMGKGVSVKDAVRNISDHDDHGVVEVDLINDNLFDTMLDQDPEDEDDIGEGEEAETPRNPERPYVIGVEEWYINETNYDQVTLTYWADDDVLADDTTRPIHEVEAVVGATNLHRFGFKSENPDIVYVRNEKLRVDYEITKDDRNYSEVIHGINPDTVQTSGSPRRMRSNDE